MWGPSYANKKMEKEDFGKLIGWKFCDWVLKMATHKSIKVENSRNYTRNLEFAQVVVFQQQ